MDSMSLMCLDWILASAEYIEFVLMMLQFRVIIIVIFCLIGEIRKQKSGTQMKNMKREKHRNEKYFKNFNRKSMNKFDALD